MIFFFRPVSYFQKCWDTSTRWHQGLQVLYHVHTWHARYKHITGLGVWLLKRKKKGGVWTLVEALEGWPAWEIEPSGFMSTHTAEIGFIQNLTRDNLSISASRIFSLIKNLSFSLSTDWSKSYARSKDHLHKLSKTISRIRFLAETAKNSFAFLHLFVHTCTLSQLLSHHLSLSLSLFSSSQVSSAASRPCSAPPVGRGRHTHSTVPRQWKTSEKIGWYGANFICYYNTNIENY